jgi:hypothetical protein
MFQWAPTLGGECYDDVLVGDADVDSDGSFQWAPTLGGECYCSQWI